jgi:hypothetical protein
MSAAHDLLNDLAAIGATIEPAGDRLILRAGAKAVPADLVKRLRHAKVELLAALSPDAIETRRWRERYTARTFEWLIGDRNWAEAKRLAWGDLENEWHEQHGQRWPAWQCAGCGKPISGAAALDLPDGNRVHLEPIDCLIAFGRRWRGDADAALVGLGLEA